VLSRRRIPDSVAGLPQTELALDYAKLVHAGQRRAFDGAPFVEHPLEVAALLYHAGAPDHVIAAGALHDAIEKTTTRAKDLRGRFGSQITNLVLAMTENGRIVDYDERKAAARERAAGGGDEALMILAADKISKVRELQVETADRDSRRTAQATTSPRQRFRHYEQCLKLLERHLPDSALVADLRTEFDRLAHLFNRSLDATAA
jgi:(p)ppGpp synthase/HD superfamily hydrolase